MAVARAGQEGLRSGQRLKGWAPRASRLMKGGRLQALSPPGGEPPGQAEAVAILAKGLRWHATPATSGGQVARAAVPGVSGGWASGAADASTAKARSARIKAGAEGLQAAMLAERSMNVQACHEEVQYWKAVGFRPR
eukprot:CAMPEP_0197911796 /NCGR_PEP_ID=MMETSP1439-20131203/73534_1 /TAXON_ID=66791 /ORGANISM="Gonyaulax spinifera, Strain CCMP409" /LENGTH=136 /DNA_ID=CAMNT_0043533551 /DNA_START=35 /DNA_END=444 /DNA_ORIENTATION=+